MAKELVVKQSNHLISAQYQLSLLEKRFMVYLISLISPGDKEFGWRTVDLDALAEIFPSAHKDVIRQFEEMADGLQSKILTIMDPDTGVRRKFNWIAAQSFDRKNRTVQVSIHPGLERHLLQLKSIYTTYSIGNITNLRSVYGIRLYELLKQAQGLRRRSFKPDELRLMLGAEDGYPRYSNFKQRIIQPAVREICRHTDIRCEFGEEFKGKKVVAVNFKIFGNERAVADGKAAAALAAGEAGTARPMLTGRFGFSDKEADAILEDRAESEVREILAIVEARVRAGAAAGRPIENVKAYARAALNDDWRPKTGSAAAESQEEARKRQAWLDEARAKEAQEREAVRMEKEAKAAAWARYEALPEGERSTLRDEFGKALEDGTARGGEYVLKQWRASGLASAGVRDSMRSWLVKSLA